MRSRQLSGFGTVMFDFEHSGPFWAARVWHIKSDGVHFNVDN